MEELFETLLPVIFPIIWFLIIFSTVIRIFRTVAKSAKNKGTGFDQDTVRKKLEELRRALGEVEEQKRAEAMGSSPANNPFPGPIRQPAQQQPKRVIRSRFEDYKGQSPQQAAFEGSGSMSMEGSSGSLEGTSEEGYKDWKSPQDGNVGSLTPFQKELLGGSLAGESTEGTGSEEPSTVKGVDTLESWAKDPLEGFEDGALEQQLQSMAKLEEPEQFDLVGWIDMKEMADAIVWQEIMSKPLAKRRFAGFRARRAY